MWKSQTRSEQANIDKMMFRRTRLLGRRRGDRPATTRAARLGSLYFLSDFEQYSVVK